MNYYHFLQFMSIEGKVVVITGASDGLGKSIALKCAEEHAKIAILARSEDKLKEVKTECESLGAEAEYYLCDVSDAAQVATTVSALKQQFGRIDILINNAGIWAAGPIESYSVEKIGALFATNTLGTIYMTRAIVPVMKQQSAGQILNVMSIAGVETKDAYGIIYTATKHALHGFTETLKEELTGNGIKIMGFYPGGMATNILKAAGIDMPSSAELSMNTKDIANIVVFVLEQPEDVVIDHFEVRKFIGKKEGEQK